MDETNVIHFCQRAQGRGCDGQRTAVALPASKGPNNHICAKSAYQMICIISRCGAFKSDTAIWVFDMLQNLPPGVRVDSVVFVCDNAPCHFKLEEYEHEFPGFIHYLSFGTIFSN